MHQASKGRCAFAVLVKGGLHREGYVELARVQAVEG